MICCLISMLKIHSFFILIKIFRLLWSVVAVTLILSESNDLLLRKYVDKTTNDILSKMVSDMLLVG